MQIVSHLEYNYVAWEVVLINSPKLAARFAARMNNPKTRKGTWAVGYAKIYSDRLRRPASAGPEQAS